MTTNQNLSSIDASMQDAAPGLTARLLRAWPLWFALIVFAVLALLALRDIHANTDDRLIYGLDDAYIHMSIARNFVEHGVWGVTQYEYTSSTSSPLWTALIALTYAVTGANTVAPVALNLLAVALLLSVSYAVMRHYTAPDYVIAAALLALVLALPLETYVYIGMEHVLHTALTVAFVALGVAAIARKESLHWNEVHALLLYVLAALLPVIRYEGAFTVGIIAGLLLLRGRWRVGLLTLGIGALPVVTYGLIAVANGWPFLPASVMMKSIYGVWEIQEISTADRVIGWIVTPFENVLDDPLFAPVAGLIVLALLLRLYKAYRTNGGFGTAMLWDSGVLLLVVLLASIVIHRRLTDSPVAFERYTVYLVVLGMVAFAAIMGAYLPRISLRGGVLCRAAPPVTISAALLLAGFGAAFTIHGMTMRDNYALTPAVTALYQQQYQMAQFLAEHYNDDVIVANDIGAITYFTNIRLFDIVGLGTLEVARSRLERTYSAEYMSHLAREAGAEIGIVYYIWIVDLLVGEAPADWVSVADWRVPDASVLGGDTVTFYALTDEAIGPLVENLLDYRDDVPPEVVQRHHMVQGE